MAVEVSDADGWWPATLAAPREEADDDGADGGGGDGGGSPSGGALFLVVRDGASEASRVPLARLRPGWQWKNGRWAGKWNDKVTTAKHLTTGRNRNRNRNRNPNRNRNRNRNRNPNPNPNPNPNQVKTAKQLEREAAFEVLKRALPLGTTVEARATRSLSLTPSLIRTPTLTLTLTPHLHPHP